MSVNSYLDTIVLDDDPIESAKKEPVLTLSLEQIKNRFDTKFTDALLEEFKKVRNEGKATDRAWRDTRVNKIVKEYMGIDVNIKAMNEYNAGVPYTDFSITATTPLAPEAPWAFFENGKEIKKSKANPVISVNAETGFISGIKDIEHIIYMGRPFFTRKDYTIKEVLAVFLHELGHIWTYYWTLPHVFKTNFLLGEYTEKFIGIDSREVRGVMIDDLEKKCDLKVVEKERLMNAETKTEVAAILFTTQLKDMKSLFGNNPYDIRNSEAMADQFVIRMGYGADLASGFTKDPEFREAKMGVVGRVLWNTVILYFTSFLLLPITLLTAIFNSSWLEDEYDSPVRRVEVILHGLRHRYKEAPAKEKKVILNQIDSIERELKTGGKEFESIWLLYYKHILPWGRSKSRQLNFQKAMEDITNSALTTRAEKLRNII